MTNVFGQQDRILGARGIIAECFQNWAKKLDRDLFAEQHLQNALHFRQLHLARDQFIDRGWLSLLQFIDQVLGRVARQDFIGVLAHCFVQVSCQDRGWLNNGVAVELRLLLRWPGSIQSAGVPKADRVFRGRRFCPSPCRSSSPTAYAVRASLRPRQYRRS